MSDLHSYGQVFSPRFFLEADGKLADDLIPYILKFEYEDEENKLDKLSLVVANPDLMWMDDPRFSQGVAFRVRWGYLSDMSDMRTAIISKARPHYPQTGMPTIEMIAFDIRAEMNRLSHPKNWGAVSSSEVARRVADLYSLDTEIEESFDARPQQRVQPVGMTDVQYLMSLATKLNWDCYIEGPVLHFHPRRFKKSPDLAFTYFTDPVGTLLRFDPDVKFDPPVGSGVSGTSTKTGKSKAGDRNVTRRVRSNVRHVNVQGQYVNIRSDGNQNGIKKGTPESEAGIIGIHGAAMGSAVDMNTKKATAEIIGTPRVRCRTMVLIEGVDRVYAGNWRVSKSKHVIDPKGYRVSLNLSRDTGDSSNNNKTADQLKKERDAANGGVRRVESGIRSVNVPGHFVVRPSIPKLF